MTSLTKFLITTLINPTDNITHMDIQELADYGIPEEVIDLYKKEGITGFIHWYREFRSC